MTQYPETFNLVEADWIPVLMTNGENKRVGIGEALMQAGNIRQIASSNPMDRVALLRLLLAVLQWCKPRLTDGERKSLQGAEGIPHEWLKQSLYPGSRPNYSFNITGEPVAYNQVLPPDTKTTPGTNVLLHESPSRTNKAHFRHVRDARAPLCLACCALGLVRLPAFTTSKGAGLYPSVNQAPPIYFTPRTETMLRTILVNWPMPVLSHDRPAWVAKVTPESEETRIGVLEGFTWVPRRLRVAEPASNGTCVWCGRSGEVWTDIAFNKPLKKDVEGIKRRILGKGWRDPHVSYLKEPKKSKATDAVDPGSLKPHDALNDPWNAAGEWRRIWSAMLSSSTDGYAGGPEWLEKTKDVVRPDEDARVEAVGFATDGKANYYDAWNRLFQVPVKILCEPETLEMARQELNWLLALIGRTIDARTASWKKPIKKLKDATFLAGTIEPDRKAYSPRAAMCHIRQQAETALQEEFLIFVHSIKSGHSAEWERACCVWRKSVERVLSRELKSAVAASFSGSPLRRREAIQLVDHALRRAVRQLEKEETKEDSNLKPMTKRRGR